MKYLPAAMLIAVLVPAVLRPLDWPMAIVFVAAALAYVHIYATELKLGISFQNRVEELNEKLFKQDSIATKEYSIIRKDYLALAERVEKLEAASDDVHKLADETKKMVSSANLGMAFRAPTRRSATTPT